VTEDHQMADTEGTKRHSTKSFSAAPEETPTDTADASQAPSGMTPEELPTDTVQDESEKANAQEPVAVRVGEKQEQLAALRRIRFDVDPEEKAETGTNWFCLCFGILLAICLLLFTSRLIREEAEEKPVLSVFDLRFKPRDDMRTFQFATLSNGVQVVTVKDPRALQKAFATAVEAGSFDDPVMLPGLAHFCEHMLFLGTKKYTDVGGFDKFFSANGGGSNAFTASEATVYFASISQGQAKEGLDRFADFFKQPLFPDEYVAKEVQAIDSEHAKNVQNPGWQARAILDSLAAVDSPVSRFHTGDLQTLAIDPKNAQPPVDPVSALKEYWKTHYCPNRLKVVTVGSELHSEQLKELQEEFGGMEAQSALCDLPREKFDAPNPWGVAQMQKWVTVQGMLPKSFMWIQFPLPDVTEMYRSEPLTYIEYVLTYGGEHSLTQLLTDGLGLAAGMDVSFDTTSAGTVMLIGLELTKQGRRIPHIIIDVIFAYLALLNREGVKEDLHNSIAILQKLSWDWGGQDDPMGTASDLAERMTRIIKPEDLLWANSLIEMPDSGLVRSLLGKLIPTNMNVVLMKEAADSDVSFTTGLMVRTLPHYGLRYTVQNITDVADLDPGSIVKWSNWLSGGVDAATIEESLQKIIKDAEVLIDVIPGTVPVPTSPRRIEGIPRVLTLEHAHAAHTSFAADQPVESLLYGPSPEKLVIDQAAHSLYAKDAEFWYRGGWMTLSPKVRLSLSLRPMKAPNEPDLTALQNLRLQLYGSLLQAEIGPKLTDITNSGMTYGIGVTGGSLNFGFAGFAPSMQTFIAEVMSIFNTFNANASSTPQVRFDRHLHQLREDLSTHAGLAISYAAQDRNMLLVKGSHSRAELLQALNDSQPTLAFIATSVSELTLSRQLHLSALAMGNMADTDAQMMVGTFLQNIKTPAEVSMARQGDQVERVNRIVDLSNPVEVRKQNPVNGDNNDVAIVSIIAGVSTVENRVSLGLLSQIFGTLAYEELRTNQQLGYMVNCGAHSLSNVQLMSCAVEGVRRDADTMEAAIHYVFSYLMPKRLKDLTDEEFDAYRKAFHEALFEPPLTTADEFGQFEGPIANGGIGFDLQNELLRYLSGPMVSKEMLEREWRKLIRPRNDGRRVIAIKYFANQSKIAARPTLEQAQKLWLDAKVPAEAREVLAHEYDVATRFTKVDSEEREKLAKAGGWFSTDMNVKLKDQSTASKTPVEVPQQIKDLLTRINKELDAFVDAPVEYTTADVGDVLEMEHNGETNSTKRRSSDSEDMHRQMQVAGDHRHSRHMVSVQKGGGGGFLLRSASN
jgi:secreted Zn-dependent insulinase-like peptidase